MRSYRYGNAVEGATECLEAEAENFFDVCDAPTDCNQLSEEQVANIDLGSFIAGLPPCIFACIVPSGIDVGALLSSMDLPPCEPLSSLLKCAVDTCAADDIDRTQFCLIQDLLRNSCQEDYDAGVVYEGGEEPIVDLRSTKYCPPLVEVCFTAHLTDSYVRYQRLARASAAARQSDPAAQANACERNECGSSHW